MSIEAMKQALEALDGRLSLMKWQAAREALRQAIEQAERFDKQPTKILSTEEVLNSAGFYKSEKQEPVAWVTDLEFDRETELIPARRKGKLGTEGMDIPLYAQPRREWIGLTDDDKQELDEKYGDDYLAHLDAVEAKLKEKNT